MKTTKSGNDPLLKKLLQQYESPQLPAGFSEEVMNSVHAVQKTYSPGYYRIPVLIKIGIPLFIMLCLGLMIIFPGDETGIINKASDLLNGNSISYFLNEINSSIQSVKLPEINISKGLMIYLLGGIGLVWLFVLFESLSRRRNNID